METTNSVYRDMAARTGGDVYLGIVGPVRTGKSTFIKRFMDTLVIPHMEDSYRRERATDELPQSAAGRTIMTTEPKFIPEQAARVALDGVTDMRVRLIDCVGYIVPSALGYIEDEQPRMVKTPWYDEEVPFNMAAEEGTRRVITDHSSVGLVVTTDGSFTDIPREEYRQAEERVIRELQEIHKPFAVLLNTAQPESDAAAQLAAQMSEQYGVPVVPVNCQTMTEQEIRKTLEALLSQFPVREVGIRLPRWLMQLEPQHPVRVGVMEAVRRAAGTVERVPRTERLPLCGNGGAGAGGSGQGLRLRDGDNEAGAVLSNLRRSHRSGDFRRGRADELYAGAGADQPKIQKNPRGYGAGGGDRLRHCDAGNGRNDPGGTGNHPAKRALRRAAAGSSALHTYDAGADHHRGLSHRRQ